MAYHSTSGTASNTADFLVRLKDFLVEPSAGRFGTTAPATPSPVTCWHPRERAEPKTSSCGSSTHISGPNRGPRLLSTGDAATRTVKEAFNTSYTYIKTVDASASCIGFTRTWITSSS